ncbi:hypothetical protein M404DRAFT_34124 [Pisolithus tinctorius Marx 270]|uniref:Uncharacterized protein n=1 Tax=Pisolithus tinctorius Marx 270 TaxID=870435 RepID=A0A0C3NII6_PISTI|nr:hypothetical protein M404DRAFT_34124 [Pisolithus tinctorius Marx 270]
MSNSRTTTMTNNNEGQIFIDWTQVSDKAIKYDTNDKEETMKAKAKERKQETEWAEAERVKWEAKEKKACKEEEKCKAKKGGEARAGDSSSEASGEVRKMVMDPVGV